MSNLRNRVLLGILIVGVVGGVSIEMAWTDRPHRRSSATSSSPIDITSDDRFVWVVNPDNNSVSVLEVAADKNRKIAEIQVGQEPQCVALTPDDSKAYVTNMVSGTVTVIDTRKFRVIKTIHVGTEPFGCAVTPDGSTLYVANSSSDDVSVINTHSDRVITTIEDVGPQPRGIAITSGPKGHHKVYVTHFLAQLREDHRSVEEKEGRDDGKEGRVTVISAAHNRVIDEVVLNPMADTGFKSNGSTLDRIPLRFDSQGNQIFDTVTGAFPNLLESIVIKGDRAYLPNSASSPNGPVRFNVSVQSFLSVIDLTRDVEAVHQTISMNRGVQFEPLGRRLFIANPIAIAFKHHSDEGFVVSAGTNRIVRVLVDDNGLPTINAPTGPADPGNIVRIAVGKNPRGIVINSTDTRAYVMNFISRDVSVVDIQTGSPRLFSEIGRISSASLPKPGTLEAIVHLGHELFVTSIGPAGTEGESVPPGGRMSSSGWQSCYGCHPDGLSNGVTFMFGDGPRQVISMQSTFFHPQPPTPLSPFGAPLPPAFHQRVISFSGTGAETESDSEITIRDVMGGQGFIRRADGSPDPCVFNLLPPPESSCPPAAVTGRSPEIDAIAAFLAFRVRAPISPVQDGNEVSRGRSLFARANCQSCHGGSGWTRGRVDFDFPPISELIVDGQLVRFLRNVGTFNPTAFNEVKANQTENAIANGALGFTIPSLLSTFSGRPYLHNGSAQTLEEVLENVTHRSAGTAGKDTLRGKQDIRALVRFLKSIDASTVPFP